MSYWQDRIKKAQEAMTEKSYKQIDKQMKKYYRQASYRVMSDFETTYNKILAQIAKGEEPSPALLYRLDSYWQQQGALKHELQRLGDKQIALLSEEFELNFFEVYYSIALEGEQTFSDIDKAAVHQLLQSVWVADGKTFSQRVWDNMDRLLETLNDGLVECVATGKKSTELKKTLQERFDISYRRANTLVVTELAHIQTRAAEERYKAYGIEEVEVLVDEDNRTCDLCRSLIGKKYPINAAPVLPLHPNERCCLVPVIKKHK